MAYKEALQGRDKDELIALIEKMVERHPDLALLLELPVPSFAQQPIDGLRITSKVTQIFKQANDAGGASSSIIAQLRDLVDFAEHARMAGAWSDVSIVCLAMAQALLDQGPLLLHDQTGELQEIVRDYVGCLSQSLDAARCPASRLAILRTMYQIYLWDIQAGCVGVGEDLAEHWDKQATMSERQVLGQWVRDLLPGQMGWRRQLFGAVLLDLEADILDEEAILQICRETGRFEDLAERLLDLNRLDEAVEAMRNIEDSDLIFIASSFVAHGHGQIIHRVIRERYQASKNNAMLEWLTKSAKSSGLLD